MNAFPRSPRNPQAAQGRQPFLKTVGSRAWWMWLILLAGLTGCSPQGTFVSDAAYSLFTQAEEYARQLSLQHIVVEPGNSEALQDVLAQARPPVLVSPLVGHAIARYAETESEAESEAGSDDSWRPPAEVWVIDDDPFEQMTAPAESAETRDGTRRPRLRWMDSDRTDAFAEAGRRVAELVGTRLEARTPAAETDQDGDAQGVTPEIAGIWVTSSEQLRAEYEAFHDAFAQELGEALLDQLIMTERRFSSMPASTTLTDAAASLSARDPLVMWVFAGYQTASVLRETDTGAAHLVTEVLTDQLPDTGSVALAVAITPQEFMRAALEGVSAPVQARVLGSLDQD